MSAQLDASFQEYLITDGIITDILFSEDNETVNSTDVVSLLAWSHDALTHYEDMIDAESDPQMWVM